MEVSPNLNSHELAKRLSSWNSAATAANVTIKTFLRLGMTAPRLALRRHLFWGQAAALFPSSPTSYWHGRPPRCRPWPPGPCRPCRLIPARLDWRSSESRAQEADEVGPRRITRPVMECASGACRRLLMVAQREAAAAASAHDTCQ